MAPNSLSYSTYKFIKEEAGIVKSRENSDQRKWYGEFELVFKSQSLDSIGDLYKFIAFAYSWMPTIPRIYLEGENEAKLEVILHQLQELRACHPIDRAKLVSSLVEIVNHSVVGASKVMHFIAPEVPIIDSRVIKAWRALFTGVENIVQFPKHLGNDPKRMIRKYLEYWKNMDTWLAQCRMEESDMVMRDLEVCLYWFGGRTLMI